MEVNEPSGGEGLEFAFLTIPQDSYALKFVTHQCGGMRAKLGVRIWI